MDDLAQNQPATSQPSPILPESTVRAIVRDEIARAKLVDENEMLKAKIAQLEAEAAAAAPGPADADPASSPGQKPAPASTKPPATSLPGTGAGGKGAGKIKWL